MVAASPVMAAFPPLQLKAVAVNQLSMPLVVTHAGDGSGRVFVAEQQGRIRVFQDGAILPQPFLNIATLVRSGGEAGLLGLAFHPDYETTGAPGQGRFYVFYSGAPGVSGYDHRDVVAEYRVSAENPNLADPASARVLLTIEHPQSNHNGGCMAFGPADGLLYISTGDGGNGGDEGFGHTAATGNALDRTNLLGKVLRIDPLGTNGPGGAYGIPASNPYVGNASGYRTEIFAYGLRNPWRFSFDSGPAGGTNRLLLGDVGQGNIEEVDIITSGGNYGWRRFEGTAIYNGSTPITDPHALPITEYTHAEYGVSVIGGYVYRGTAIPALQGKYVFGDYTGTANGQMLGLEDHAPGAVRAPIVLSLTGGLPSGLRILCFGTDQAGEIYLGATAGGTSNIYKIIAPPLVLTRRETWEQQYFSVGTFIDPKEDLDADAIPNLFEYAWDLHPRQRNAATNFFGTTFNVGTGQYNITFRRDPRATDLTYVLEGTSNFVTWEPWVTSTAGGTPTGSGYLSEAADPGNPTVRIVQARDPQSYNATVPRFVRLRLVR